HRDVLRAARRRRRRRDRYRLPLPLHPFLARGLRSGRPCRPDDAAHRSAAADRPRLQPRARRLPAMKHYLGIDIGTYESKGVLVGETGRIVASAARPHRMLVPQPGWAEHRPREDWWDDFCAISRQLLA